MLNRREFLTAFKKPLENIDKKKVVLLRPPYGKDELSFETICVNCQEKKCKTFCEENIIIIGADGTPILNFKNSGCTFCQECAKNCDYDVLSLENKIEKINAKFFIDTKKCMSHNNIICFSCKEPCIDDAILFAGMFKPVIDMDKCTACGFCVARCPSNAINYEPIEIKNKG